MAFADRVSDKLTCFNAIIGFVMGIILSYYHNDSNLWINAIKFAIVIAAVMVIIPTVAGIYSREKYHEKFPLNRVIPMYLLIVAEITICAALGIVVGSYIFGNYEVELLNLR